MSLNILLRFLVISGIFFLGILCGCHKAPPSSLNILNVYLKGATFSTDQKGPEIPLQYLEKVLFSPDYDKVNLIVPINITWSQVEKAISIIVQKFGFVQCDSSVGRVNIELPLLDEYKQHWQYEFSGSSPFINDVIINACFK